MLDYSRNKKGGPPTYSVMGFTLVELLVSISIMVIILTVVILNQSKYTDGTGLTALADEISLTITQTQAYSIGVKEFAAGTPEQKFSASYGLSFSLLSSGSDKAYINFADLDGDNIYDGDWSCPTGGPGDECLSRIDISRGNYITSLCSVDTSDNESCNVGRIDISFVRPNTEAQIKFFDSNGLSFVPVDMKGAKIVLNSPGGATRSVTVYTTGQVSVQ